MHGSSSNYSTPSKDELRFVSTSLKDIIHPELHRRASDGGFTKVTKSFLAMMGVEQVGFLSVDPHLDGFYIHTIYVVRNHRRKHIGSYLLKEAENFAASHGYTFAKLKPHALDPECVGRDILLRWYVSQGYVPVDPGDSEWFIKRLAI
ncbi:GNAT family N-acetyltransferase [Corallococcus exercitus]|uniref:GNAT family N-acetyltransferase n=1 Tax=Corallococcus exercitus TaxID=2316736 RepID=A0A7Y4KMV5_9BACT|nr:GNAT family N-acetyltransferase [Corallococcus exercitus]NOK36768.1 GNAT family N-acetyltransferase [Corallococcus exercitus]